MFYVDAQFELILKFHKHSTLCQNPPQNEIGGFQNFLQRKSSIGIFLFVRGAPPPYLQIINYLYVMVISTLVHFNSTRHINHHSTFSNIYYLSNFHVNMDITIDYKFSDVESNNLFYSIFVLQNYAIPCILSTFVSLIMVYEIL